MDFVCLIFYSKSAIKPNKSAKFFHLISIEPTVFKVSVMFISCTNSLHTLAFTIVASSKHVLNPPGVCLVEMCVTVFVYLCVQAGLPASVCSAWRGNPLPCSNMALAVQAASLSGLACQWYTLCLAPCGGGRKEHSGARPPPTPLPPSQRPLWWGSEHQNRPREKW